jgi:arabinan endo-1,5-alpha-L-arabinosidase
MGFQRKTVAPGVEALEGRLPLDGAGEAPTVPARSAAVGAPGGDVAGVTDPRIIRQGDTYYLFSTGPGIPIHVSTDLIHWHEAGPVFETTPAWAAASVPGARSIWAPDISYFDGLYHLYYAVSTFGSQRSVIGLATNSTLDPSAPGYQWIDQGEVIASRPGRDHFNAIDPNLVIDSHSRVWLAFGSQWSGLKLVAIDPATGKPRHPPGKRHALASRPGHAPIEAPFVFEKDGYYYLFASFDSCCMGVRSTYKIMVGRSRSITGPYRDRRGHRMSEGGGTLVFAGDDRFRGPGHNAVLSDGENVELIYHAYDALDDGVPILQIRALRWSPRGWPVIGPALF